MKEFNLNFVGIGAQRSATTWLAECLREHPEICLAHPKELEFFSGERFKFGLEWYKKHFHIKKQNKVLGEFTSTYIYVPQAAERIKQVSPDVKIITCLRNPIDRHISHKMTKPLDRGLYYSHLKHYFDLFPRTNILVMIYEDIVQNPQAFISRIYSFLGVDSSFTPKSLDQIINPKKSYKLPFVKNSIDKVINLIENSKIGVYIKKVLIKLGFRTLFYKIDKANTKQIIKTELSAGEREKLKKFYQEDVRKLEQLLNRKLWSDISQ